MLLLSCITLYFQFYIIYFIILYFLLSIRTIQDKFHAPLYCSIYNLYVHLILILAHIDCRLLIFYLFYFLLNVHEISNFTGFTKLEEFCNVARVSISL